MHLSYAGIEFKLLLVTDYQRAAIWTEDQVDYLYDSINLRCQCILNPQATSMNNAPGWSPVVTLNDIADRLKRPRQQLSVWMDSSVDNNGNAVGNREDILISPLPGYEVDARVGPQCLVHKIDCSHGNSSIWMDLEFSTDIRTCPEPTVDGVPNPMIGNRWTMSVEHDPTNFTAIRTTTGTAHFRQDMLDKYHYTADQFRKFFIHPIPLGFRRDPPHIVLHPDGCAVSYTFSDREQLLSFVGGVAYGATDIEVVETRAYVNPPLNPARGPAMAMNTLIDGAIGAATGFMLGGPIGMIIGGIGGGIMGGARSE